MTAYRLFPSTNGPSAATSYSGDYIAGVDFEVTSSGMWFEGFWWWVCSTGGQSASPVKCALWNATSNITGVLVPGSTVTSGTLSPGWNWIPLATPIPIAIGTPYLAQIGVNGPFPLTQNQFGSGDPLASGIVNGPLVAYSSTPDGGTANGTPYNLWQAQYSQANSDPTVAFPSSNLAASNLWADVQVSDTGPGGYSGTYRLWPNKADSSQATGLDTNLPFTLATEIRLSDACAASWLWFYSYAGAASLPTWAGVYPAAGAPGVTAPVAQNSSPSWLTPDGSQAATAGGGWCKCALSATLPAGSYRAAVYNSAGGSGAWSPREYGYFLTGAGANGISWGPVSSPAWGSASMAWVYQSNGASSPPYTDGSSTEAANGTFARDSSLATGSPQFPYLEVNYNKSAGSPAGAIAESFWVDLEVTPLSATTGTGSAVSAKPSLSGAGALQFPGAGGAAAVKPSLAAGGWASAVGGGAVALAKPALSGAGVTFLPVTGTGGVVVPKPSLLGRFVPPPSVGSWWGLDTILKENRSEFDAYWSRPPLDCPVCGQPLVNAPSTAAGSGVELYCNYAGDHQYHYPRDRDVPVRMDSGSAGGWS